MAATDTYFDYAAATPMLPQAIEQSQPFLATNFYNPAALYLKARENKQVLEQAREAIAQGLGVRPVEVIFTAGGTEANNMAVYGIMNEYDDAHAVTTAIEHESVLKPIEHYRHTLVGVDTKGFVSAESIKTAINDKTVLVSVMYANNEVGSIQPLKEIAEIVKTVRAQRRTSGNIRPLYFHTDACQASNYLDMQVSRLGVDLLTINAGKIYGPKQCGALYVRAGVILRPLILGGGQERNQRSGTENLANIVAFATAWSVIRADYQSEARRVAALRDSCIKQIEKGIPSVVLNGPRDSRRLANNMHITLPGIDNERLLMELDELGFQIATGSACSASSDEPSHVLSAMGVSEPAARNSARISFGRYSNQLAVDKLAQSIIKVVALS